MRIPLDDGSRGGVIGGGPAGSLFANFLLTFRRRVGLRESGRGGTPPSVPHPAPQSVRPGTPLKEKRIAAIHRGGGPRDLREARWGGLDGYLLRLVRELGANVIPRRVDDVSWEGERPVARLSGSAQPPDPPRG